MFWEKDGCAVEIENISNSSLVATWRKAGNVTDKVMLNLSHGKNVVTIHVTAEDENGIPYIIETISSAEHPEVNNVISIENHQFAYDAQELVALLSGLPIVRLLVESVA